MKETKPVSPYEPTLKRRLTAWDRIWPSFLVIGENKCGTTSLYHYLLQHPCVGWFRKEIHFFDLNYAKGYGWYKAHFPLLFLIKIKRNQYGCSPIVGDVSPYYMIHPHTPKRIADKLSHVKLIALLRNPVDRAYSHYQHQVRKGRETLPFVQAVEAEEARLDGELSRMLSDETYQSFNYRHFSYLARGRYINQLKIWFSHFPPEQFLLLKSEDLFENPAGTMNRIFEFLQLPSWKLTDHRRYNPGNYYADIGTVMRNKLINYFGPFNQRLYEFLGVDFGWN